MKYKDPVMEKYFLSLPQNVKGFINASEVEISTPGDLMLIGEHFKVSFPSENQESIK
ncbi:hypothetical protein KL86CLO1_11849 [uncultured Eubacteriales bacterium]|uniref:Uncharacterized protein n=1 Tax=uncultured Eubacteriales bacterium TaxID=172733 RepID=A0A212JWY4_9FIRM|nr:hypothetical protein KL86CLO1_11849 [uncultured Eubacteriales bacterium]